MDVILPASGAYAPHMQDSRDGCFCLDAVFPKNCCGSLERWSPAAARPEEARDT